MLSALSKMVHCAAHLRHITRIHRPSTSPTQVNVIPDYIISSLTRETSNSPTFEDSNEGRVMMRAGRMLVC
jgi:hypothetical protein